MIKGIRSPVAGEADIFLVPDLEAGNMLAAAAAEAFQAGGHRSQPVAGLNRGD